MSWSPEAYEAVLDELEDREPELTERLMQAVEGAFEHHEEGAVQFLLDGLGVGSIRDLARLVEEGKSIRQLERREPISGVPPN